MSEEILEVWLTKRALIVGVEKVQVRSSRLGPPFVVEAGGKGQTYVLGQEAYLERSEAIAAAEAERTRRLRILQEQIDRIRSLDFQAETAVG